MAFQSVLPEFDSLPLHPEDPPHSAWGLYEPNDQLGSLNRLTDETVTRAAREEIQTGSRYGSNTTMLEHNFSAIEQSYGRISLNWPLDAQKVWSPNLICLYNRVATQRRTAAIAQSHKGVKIDNPLAVP